MSNPPARGWPSPGRPERLFASLAVLQQAITAHATRGAEKLRRHGLVAAHMTVFFHTNLHNGSSRDSASRTAKLSPPSNTRWRWCRLLSAAQRMHGGGIEMGTDLLTRKQA